MQPRHTEPGAGERPVTTPKARSTAPGTTQKPAPEKPKQEKPREKTVEFRLSMPQARTVCVVGTFNNWDTKRTPMQKDATGWKASVPLAPGRYEYRFVAD